MKKILALALSLIIIAGGLGFGAYYYFLVPDTDINKQLDESFGSDFFEIFNLEGDPALINEGNPLPSEKPLSLNGSEGNTVTSEKENGKDRTIQEENNSQDHQTESDNSKEEKTTDSADEKESLKVTTDDIIKRYEPKIISLENIALERLTTLYTTAMEEYLKQRKEGKVNRTELARKYLQAAVRLENNVDAIFYEILDEMEKELKTNQLSTSIISTIKKEYNTAKTEMRKEYLGSFSL